MSKPADETSNDDGADKNDVEGVAGVGKNKGGKPEKAGETAAGAGGAEKGGGAEKAEGAEKAGTSKAGGEEKAGGGEEEGEEDSTDAVKGAKVKKESNPDVAITDGKLDALMSEGGKVNPGVGKKDAKNTFEGAAAAGGGAERAGGLEKHAEGAEKAEGAE